MPAGHGVGLGDASAEGTGGCRSTHSRCGLSLRDEAPLWSYLFPISLRPHPPPPQHDTWGEPQIFTCGWGSGARETYREKMKLLVRQGISRRSSAINTE